MIYAGLLACPTEVEMEPFMRLDFIDEDGNPVMTHVKDDDGNLKFKAKMVQETRVEVSTHVRTVEKTQPKLDSLGDKIVDESGGDVFETVEREEEVEERIEIPVTFTDADGHVMPKMIQSRI